MTYVSTYSQNEDVASHFPLTFNSTSKPSQTDVENFRLEIYGMINQRLGGATADSGGLKRLEVRKVIQLIENYWARGRGERTYPVSITEEDLTDLRLNQSEAGDGYGGGHYSVNIPG